MTNGEFIKEMGNKIRTVRMARKLTLRQLSDLCQMDVSALNLIELGKKNSYLLTIKKIADTLGMDIKDFL